MLKDDLAIHTGIPDKVIKSALTTLREDERLASVEWDVPKRKGSRPTKVYFKAERLEDVRAAKDRLEEILRDAGYELYP